MKIHIPLVVENFFHLPCCRPKSSWEETELLSSMLSSRYSSSLVLRADRLLLWESIKLDWRKRPSLPEYRGKWQLTHKTYSAFQIQQHTNLATKLQLILILKNRAYFEPKQGHERIVLCDCISFQIKQRQLILGKHCNYWVLLLPALIHLLR